MIDHRNTAGTVANSAGKTPFWAFQSFVAPSTSSGSAQNEAYLAVSNDGGYTWADRAVACSTSSSQKSLGHQFPDVSVDPSGNLWMAWSDDTNVFTAESSDHGATWSCSGPVSTNSAQAVFPWLVATSGGVDLVYYGSTTAPGPTQSWSVYFAQNTAGTAAGWGAPGAVVPVHQGTVCEAGATCSSGRSESPAGLYQGMPSGVPHSTRLAAPSGANVTPRLKAIHMGRLAASVKRCPDT